MDECWVLRCHHPGTEARLHRITLPDVNVLLCEVHRSRIAQGAKWRYLPIAHAIQLLDRP